MVQFGDARKDCLPLQVNDGAADTFGALFLGRAVAHHIAADPQLGRPVATEAHDHRLAQGWIAARADCFEREGGHRWIHPRVNDQQIGAKA